MTSLPVQFARTTRAAFARAWFPLLLLAVVIVIGYGDRALDTLRRTAPAMPIADPEEFFCPMDPQVVRGEPAKCPICGMPLSKRARPLAAVELPPNVLARVQLTPYQVALARVVTTAVTRRPLEATLDMVGTITTDQRRIRRISSRVSGRIDRLSVAFTGAVVERGDPLLWLYSPRIFSAAEEMLESRNTRGGGFDAAREQLELFGVTRAQVDGILASGEAPTHLDVLSPTSGTVIAKHVIAGDHVDQGTPLYTLADLSVLWMVGRVFEDEVRLVDVGRQVEIRADSSPERLILGHVAFVDPVVDRASRTVGVRVDVPDPHGLLRPGALVRARLRTPIGADGLLRSRATTVVYRCCEACPQVASSVPGECLQCAMPLTPVEVVGPATSGSGEWVCRCRMHPNDVYRAPGPGACALCASMLVEEVAPVVPTARSRTVLLYECPGHPETTRGTPGVCLLCGTMELIPREATSEEAQVALARAKPRTSRPLPVQQAPVPASKAQELDTEAPLVVPAEAVIDTGTRRVVYVESGPGVFDAVDVTLGPRVDDWFGVIRGLIPGQRVVARGAFLVDAQARLNPSSASVYFGASSAGSSRAGLGATTPGDR